MVSKKMIQELQEIIRSEYELEISYESASEIANGLVGYYKTLARINHRLILNKE